MILYDARLGITQDSFTGHSHKILFTDYIHRHNRSLSFPSKTNIDNIVLYYARTRITKILSPVIHTRFFSLLTLICIAGHLLLPSKTNSDNILYHAKLKITQDSLPVIHTRFFSLITFICITGHLVFPSKTNIDNLFSSMQD
jgi:hypothetical protein